MMNLNVMSKFSLAIIGAATLGACSSDTNSAPNSSTAASTVTAAVQSVDPSMSFFLTSVGPGDGANLGGLAGADAYCASLATAAGVSGKDWKAYLSTTGANGVNAKDRIGAGPWTNANGVVVATSVANLLDAEGNNLSKANSISETGAVINGRGDRPNRHDILTGTQITGLASAEEGDSTCSNWTSNGEGSALVGHHDRTGGGPNPTHWSTAHGSRGCSQENLRSSGGDGLFYCFAK